MANHPNRSKRIALDFSGQELRLLWHALCNGAGDDALANLGLSRREQRVLAEACNKIKAAGGLPGPAFGVDGLS